MLTGNTCEEVRIRAATPSDADVIARFNCALAAESEDIHLDPETVRVGVLAVLNDANLGHYFVAEAETRPIGQTMITPEWTDWRNGWFWWIQSVYVQTAFRQRGVFRKLYGHVRRVAQQRGDVVGLRLYVETRNTAAQRTYERLGMLRSPYFMYADDWSGLGGRD